MTKEELDSIIAGVTANLAPAATAPVAPATAGWVAQAKSAQKTGWAGPAGKNAKAKPVKVEPTAKAPRQLQYEVQTVIYDATKHRAPFEPFKVLVIHNGANGRAHRSVRLDARFLAAVLTAVKSGISL